MAGQGPGSAVRSQGHSGDQWLRGHYSPCYPSVCGLYLRGCSRVLAHHPGWYLVASEPSRVRESGGAGQGEESRQGAVCRVGGSCEAVPVVGDGK